MTYIREYSPESREYQNLKYVSDLLTKNSPNGYLYEVGETYFDYGQDWVYTTILCDDGRHRYQCFYPKQYEEVVMSPSFQELDYFVRQFFLNDHCLDKERKVV